MKKLMSALAISALAAISMAQSSGSVTSQNVVGYVTRGPNVGAGEFMANIGVPLMNMNTSDGSYGVTNSIFQYTCQANDSVYIFNPVNYDFDIYTFNGVGAGWFVLWSDGSSSTIPSYTVHVGDNVFFVPQNGTNAVTIAGQVKSSGTQSVVFDQSLGYMFPIANPFPIDTRLSDLQTFVQANDAIYVFNQINYDFDIYTYNGIGLGWFVLWSNGTSSTIMDSSTVLLPTGKGGFYMPNGAAPSIRTWNVTLVY